MASSKNRILITFLSALLMYPHLLLSQTTSEPAAVRRYSSGVIEKLDRKRYEGTSLVFDAENLTFQDKNSSTRMKIPLSEIHRVRARVGTHAMEGALIGGGLFLLAAVTAILEVEADPYSKLKYGVFEIIAVSTAIGTGGGLIIGMMFPKQKPVFLRGKFLVYYHTNTSPTQSRHGAFLVGLGLPL